ncbi:hypothetical protein SAMN05660284_01689 [Formivibrio citricus]|uniref:TraB family protein n=1 Tax=Formivibrio citricus TaxID=83765 RepID=A0A1I4ZRJ9_9NEIS|nr:TraB/GumN family protein [Formivibrio citricus]SFN52896.1 hypothetical protein SAMN05660284_01689 [Formivibrio citricus]
MLLWRTWLALFCSLLLTTSFSAAETTPAETQTGLLWKIERPGLVPSWLFGTIHLSDPEVARLPQEASQALADAQTVITEIKLDDGSEMLAVVKEMQAPNKPLPTLLGERDFARLAAALARHGYPEPFVAGLQPWAAWMLLALPAPQENAVLPLDMQIASLAKQKKLANRGLETAEEQLALFKHIDPNQLQRLIRFQLDHPQEESRLFGELIAAYRRGDLSALLALSLSTDDSVPEEDRAWARSWMREMNEVRNQRMAQRLQPILANGGAFVAVGALHLPGPEGLIALLRTQGYRITPTHRPATTTPLPQKEPSHALPHAAGN